MGSFLKNTPPRRTRVYLPPVLPHDSNFDVVVSQEAREAGEIWIESDGKRQVTIARDGTIIIHDELST